jgi:hypothetical protein
MASLEQEGRRPKPTYEQERGAVHGFLDRRSPGEAACKTGASRLARSVCRGNDPHAKTLLQRHRRQCVLSVTMQCKMGKPPRLRRPKKRGADRSRCRFRHREQRKNNIIRRPVRWEMEWSGHTILASARAFGALPPPPRATRSRQSPLRKTIISCRRKRQDPKRLNK